MIWASWRTVKRVASTKARDKCLLPHLAFTSPFFLPFDLSRLLTARA